MIPPSSRLRRQDGDTGPMAAAEDVCRHVLHRLSGKHPFRSGVKLRAASDGKALPGRRSPGRASRCVLRRTDRRVAGLVYCFTTATPAELVALPAASKALRPSLWVPTLALRGGERRCRTRARADTVHGSLNPGDPHVVRRVDGDRQVATDRGSRHRRCDAHRGMSWVSRRWRPDAPSPGYRPVTAAGGPGDEVGTTDGCGHPRGGCRSALRAGATARGPSSRFHPRPASEPAETRSAAHYLITPAFSVPRLRGDLRGSEAPQRVA